MRPSLALAKTTRSSKDQNQLDRIFTKRKTVLLTMLLFHVRFQLAHRRTPYSSVHGGQPSKELTRQPEGLACPCVKIKRIRLLDNQSIFNRKL